MSINLALAISSVAIGTRTNTVQTEPSGGGAGDFYVGVWRSHQVDLSVTLPSGWTTLKETVDPTVRVGRTNISYIRRGASAPDLTWVHANGSTMGAIYRLTGVIASGAPEDATNTVAYDDADPFTWTALTTATANSAVLGIMARRSSTSTASATTYTERLDIGGLMIQAAIQAAAGATGSVVATESSDNDCSLYLLALKEEPVGITFDAASNSGDQAASANYTFNRTVAASSPYLSVNVELLTVTGATVTSVTDDDGAGNVALTFLGAQSTVTGAGRVECWGLANPTAGTKAIRVILSASIESVATAQVHGGVHQTVPVEGFNSAQATNAGSATDASVSITSVADNCWPVAACVANDTSITANQTTRNNVSGTLGSGADEDKGAAVTPAGATTMSYSGMGITTTWAIAGYALRPLAASGLGGFRSRIAGGLISS